MNKFQLLLTAIGFSTISSTLQSCDNDKDITVYNYPTALVTICPDSDESFVMNLDENTVLKPINLTKSPYGTKEVRALVNYYYVADDAATGTQADKDEINIRNVHICWIDSIRTKLPVIATTDNNETYGNDPFEIVRDWVTIGEDGYLTMRIRTYWSDPDKKHTLNLVTGVNPDNPMEMELHHDADGDVSGMTRDALIAFNLNNLDGLNGEVTLKLKWNSFSGEKTAEIDLKMRNDNEPDANDRILAVRNLE